MKRKELMKISDLSKRSGIPSSTIRYYTLQGLLPQPLKTSKTCAYFSKHHQAILELIIHKRNVEKKSLETIKAEVSPQLLHADESDNEYDFFSAKKDKILSAAIQLFLHKRYADTSISDIANKARMSKETIYLNFKSKDEIFMACAEKVFHEMYIHLKNKIQGESDIVQRLIICGKVFFDFYPEWANKINLVKNLSVGNNPIFKQKFYQLMRQLTGLLANAFEQLKKENRLRSDMDSDLAAFMFFGMIEYAASFASQGFIPKMEALKSIISFFTPLLACSSTV